MTVDISLSAMRLANESLAHDRDQAEERLRVAAAVTREALPYCDCWTEDREFVGTCARHRILAALEGEQ